MNQREPAQPGLFDDDAGSTGLVAVSGAKATLTRAQREFNRLIEQIERRRAALASWEAALERYRARVASEVVPLRAQMRDAQRRLVRRLDALLAPAAVKSDRPSRKERERVRSALRSLIEHMLEEGADAELQALHDRHGDLSLDEKRELDLELAQFIAGGIFGQETVEGIEADNAEDLMRQAAMRMHERMQSGAQAREAERAQRAARRGPTRAEQAALDASRSVREVFRKLASALHPDRETEPVERQRKTLLMQRANQAYERNDLLALLSLQIEIEQIDPEHLAGVPEQRIVRFNRVLKEQLRSLEREAADLVAPFHGTQPHQLGRLVDVDVAGIRQVIARIESDLAGLDDPARRRAVLDALAQDDDDESDDELDDAGLEVLAALLDGAPAAPRTAPRRARKRRRKRK